MHASTRIFWANLTPFSLQLLEHTRFNVSETVETVDNNLIKSLTNMLNTYFLNFVPDPNAEEGVEVCGRPPPSLSAHDSIQIYTKFRTISPTWLQHFFLPQVPECHKKTIEPFFIFALIWCAPLFIIIGGIIYMENPYRAGGLLFLTPL